MASNKPPLDLTGRKNLLYNRLSREIEYLLKFRKECEMGGPCYESSTRGIHLYSDTQKLLDEIFMGEED